jgi:hypothetical protein
MFPATVRVLRHLGMLIVDIHEEDLIAKEPEVLPQVLGLPCPSMFLRNIKEFNEYAQKIAIA